MLDPFDGTGTFVTMPRLPLARAARAHARTPPAISAALGRPALCLLFRYGVAPFFPCATLPRQFSGLLYIRVKQPLCGAGIWAENELDFYR